MIPIGAYRAWWIAIGFGLAGAVWAQDNTAAAATLPEEIERLPAFVVAEPKGTDFLLQYGPYEKKFSWERKGFVWEPAGPTRLWLIQWASPKEARRDPAEVKTELRLDAVFRGRGLKSGDEIVRIAGKPLTGKQPVENMVLFLAAVGDAGKKGVEIEVQASGEKGVRKMLVTKIARPRPGEAFQTFVTGLRVTGALAGAKCQVEADQKVYRRGEILDAPLGIRLLDVDLSNHLVLFEDRTGARVFKPIAHVASSKPAGSK